MLISLSIDLLLPDESDEDMDADDEEDDEDEEDDGVGMASRLDKLSFWMSIELGARFDNASADCCMPGAGVFTDVLLKDDEDNEEVRPRGGVRLLLFMLCAGKSLG